MTIVEITGGMLRAARSLIGSHSKAKRQRDMAKKKALLDAEALVRRVLTKSFKQKPDAETARAVAKKISQIVAESAAKKASEGGLVLVAFYYPEAPLAIRR